MTSTIIHVNRHRITANRRNGTQEPCIAVRRGRSGEAKYHQQVELVNENNDVVARINYTPDRPLRCGAVVYIETSLAVKPSA